MELAEKVKRGLTENALKAKANGGTRTFGYTVNKDRYYEIDPPAAMIVREMRLYADGKKMKQIRDILDEREVTNYQGKKFNFNQIQRMLSNRKYMGEYRFGEVVIPDAMPVIIEKELFDKVQEMLIKNKRAPSRHKVEDDYLLTANVVYANGQWKSKFSKQSKFNDIDKGKLIKYKTNNRIFYAKHYETRNFSKNFFDFYEKLPLTKSKFYAIMFRSNSHSA